MDIQVIAIGTVTIVEGKSAVSIVDDAVELVAACMEHNTDRLFLDASVLPSSFFQLHTRFAGEFLQKLQNYRLRTAIVIPADEDYDERFEEYLREAKKARFSRIFTARDEALLWLAQE